MSVTNVTGVPNSNAIESSQKRSSDPLTCLKGVSTSLDRITNTLVHVRVEDPLPNHVIPKLIENINLFHTNAVGTDKPHSKIESIKSFFSSEPPPDTELVELSNGIREKITSLVNRVGLFPSIVAPQWAPDKIGPDYVIALPVDDPNPRSANSSNESLNETEEITEGDATEGSQETPEKTFATALTSLKEIYANWLSRSEDTSSCKVYRATESSEAIQEQLSTALSNLKAIQASLKAENKDLQDVDILSKMTKIVNSSGICIGAISNYIPPPITEPGEFEPFEDYCKMTTFSPTDDRRALYNAAKALFDADQVEEREQIQRTAEQLQQLTTLADEFFETLPQVIKQLVISYPALASQISEWIPQDVETTPPSSPRAEGLGATGSTGSATTAQGIPSVASVNSTSTPIGSVPPGSTEQVTPSVAPVNSTSTLIGSVPPGSTEQVTPSVAPVNSTSTPVESVPPDGTEQVTSSVASVNSTSTLVGSVPPDGTEQVTSSVASVNSTSTSIEPILPDSTAQVTPSVVPVSNISAPIALVPQPAIAEGVDAILKPTVAVAPGQALGICYHPKWGSEPIAFVSDDQGGWKGQVPMNIEWKVVLLQDGQIMKWENRKNRRCGLDTKPFSSRVKF